MKRKIIERLLACLIIGTAVFTFSCKGVSNSVNDEIKDKTDEQNKAVLRLSASTKNARTALPSINVEDFTEFALYGVKISGDSAALQYDELGKWNDSSKMQNASIESSLGKWNFKLSAKKGGAEYEKTLEDVDIHSGENTLEFELELKATGSEGSGTVKIDVSFAKGFSPYYTANLTPVDTDEVLNTKTGHVEEVADSVSGSILKLSFEDVPAGSSKIELSFYEDSEKQLLIGSATEYAHVISGVTSYSLLPLGSLDQVYSIKYFKEQTEIQGFDAVNYTRRNPLNLPDASVVQPMYPAYYFCGWYENPLLDGSSVQKIAKYTVGNKEYFGKFVEKKSYAPIKQVLVQGTRKTGSTLSAIPYITDSENPTENDKFAGEIESFQWYRGESSEDGQIEWTPISLQTGETYKLTPADVGKYIKVELKQKFTAQLDEEKGIYVINQTGESVSSNQTAASGLVQKGSLNQETLTDLFNNEDFELTYNNNNPVLIGSLLDEDKISASSSTLTIEDENNNPVAISFAFNLEQKTPENGSNYVPFVVKADGYSEVPVSAVQKLLFVYVKANVLSSEIIQSLLSTTVNRIPKGKLAFAQLNNALEYSVNNGATWNEIITNDFAKPEKLLVRIKEIAGTQDNNSKPVGFIACSEPSDVPIADANIGTLVVVTDAEICVTTPENGTLSFGNTVTAIPVYSENAHVYNSVSDGELSYKWFYELDAEADEWQQIAGANSASYIIEETASIGKKLKVEITQSHPNGFTYTGDGTSVGNVVKGSLSAESTTLNYTDAVVVVGGTLSAEKISSTIYTNQAGTQVTPVLEFTNSVVPEGACSVNAKAVLAGYNDLALTVVLAAVKAPAPTSSCFESFLSGEISFIPKNYIRFTQEAVSNHLLYSTDGETFTAAQANQEIQITNSLYLKTGAYTGAAGPVSTSDVSENLFSSLSDYLGLCLIKAGGPNLITFESEEITLTYLNNVITATVPSGITITKWEIAGESLSDFATVSADKTTLTFASNAVEGTYNVTIWAFRNGNIISTTCTVTLEDSGN